MSDIFEFTYVPDKYSSKEYRFRLKVDHELREALKPLSRDREIMQELSDKFPLAHIEHEKNIEQQEKREAAIKFLSYKVTEAIKEMIEQQNTVNGYDAS